MRPPQNKLKAQKKKKKKSVQNLCTAKAEEKKHPSKVGSDSWLSYWIHKKAIRRRKKYKALKSRFCSKKV